MEQDTAYESNCGRNRPVIAPDFDWSVIEDLLSPGSATAEADYSLSDVRSAQMEFGRRLVAFLVVTKLGEIRAAQAIGVQVLGLGYVLGVKPGVSLEELAGPSDLTRAAIHKAAAFWRDYLGSAAPAQKAESSRKTYADIQSRIERQRGPGKRVWRGFDALCDRIAGEAGGDHEAAGSGAD